MTTTSQASSERPACTRVRSPRLPNTAIHRLLTTSLKGGHYSYLCVPGEATAGHRACMWWGADPGPGSDGELCVPVHTEDRIAHVDLLRGCVLTRGDAFICRRSTSNGEKVGPVGGWGKKDL